MMATNAQMVCGPLQPQMNQATMNPYAHLNNYAPTDYRNTMPAVTTTAPIQNAPIATPQVQPPGPSNQIIESMDDSNNRRGNYKSQFTTEALAKLLELVKINYPKLRNKQVKKLKVWEQIKQELEHMVPGVTRDQVDKKWRNLLFSYKKYLINRAKNGKNRLKKPEMFDEIKSIVGEGHTIKYRFVPTNNFAGQSAAPPINNVYPFTEPEVNLVVFDGQQNSEPPSPPEDSPTRDNKKDKKSRAQVRMDSIQTSLDRLVREVGQMRKEEMQVTMLRLQEEREFRSETREFHKEFLGSLKKRNESLEKYIALKAQRN